MSVPATSSILMAFGILPTPAPPASQPVSHADCHGSGGSRGYSDKRPHQATGKTPRHQDDAASGEEDSMCCRCRDHASLCLLVPRRELSVVYVMHGWVPGASTSI
ncbi:hypothetical protein EJ05DRAFT_473185 [Pseudovirgaria hyperparasitica]|uniref:Uncharacterized protein n=1 Tax=Pseudovirgaria hyperparasitica TaxID=470096 RepID=A0A6A6WJD3_9PEZI|nr:uncharacterized protein EJ05DRAFT_473185 [Pseudovirgaria hyperparasitica]KAF2762270.1 hypothetical protein EJ05DRAFT_473185 [Pseudovirgaria hyperparasitica]